MPSNVGDVHPVTDDHLYIDANIAIFIDIDRDPRHNLLSKKFAAVFRETLRDQARAINIRDGGSDDVRHHIFMDMNDSQIDLIGLFHLWTSASVFNIFSRKCVVTSPFKNDGWLTISLCSGMVVLIGAT